MSIARHLRRILGACVVIGVIVFSASLVLNAYSALQRVNTLMTPVTKPVIFDDLTELRAKPGGLKPVPSWIPSDATLIRIDFALRTGGAMLMFTSSAHFTTGTCTKSTATPKPTVRDSWWPRTPPKSARSCGSGWRAFAIDNQVYAWIASVQPAN